MPRTPPPDFAIHVDPSCVSRPGDLKMKVQDLKKEKRNDSDQTVIRHTPEIPEDDRIKTDEHDVHEVGALEEAQSYTLPSEIGTEGSWESDIDSGLSGDQDGSHVDGASHLSSLVSQDEHTERLIHAAARAVVASIEKEAHNEDESMVSNRTADSAIDDYSEIQIDVGDQGSDHSYQSDISDHYDESTSSNHEDDVFSDHHGSHRSSLNSFLDPQTDEERREQEEHEQDEFAHKMSSTSSRVSDAYSMMPEPLTFTSPITPHAKTPSTSRMLPRPPFRTPSSVRALQMSSPAPSLSLGSPRSLRKVKTPGRFKMKKEYPLVLLHVTVLPIHWPYADIIEISSEGWSREMLELRQSWRLVQEKLGDMVLERGILLPHPQDDFEVLEERLLEALELPVRPRAKILSCGHYLGPEAEFELESDLDDGPERWCDICGREVLFEDFGIANKQKRFRVKVYASNGLMRAGAWSAAWREMERVDVEIEPLVEEELAHELDALIDSHEADLNQTEEQLMQHVEDAETRKLREEERMREIYGTPLPPPVPASSPPASPLREPHDEPVEPVEQPAMPRTSSRSVPHKRRANSHDDSLLGLLWAATKVAMRDQKNIAICVLSVLVLLLALRPSTSSLSAHSKTEPSISQAVSPSGIIGTTVHVASAGMDTVESMAESVGDMSVAVGEKVQDVVSSAKDIVVDRLSAADAPPDIEGQSMGDEAVDEKRSVAHTE